MANPLADDVGKSPVLVYTGDQVTGTRGTIGWCVITSRHLHVGQPERLYHPNYTAHNIQDASTGERNTEIPDAQHDPGIMLYW